MEARCDCPRCGTENPSGTLNCIECGYKLSSDEKETDIRLKSGDIHSAMLKEIRSWGIWSLALGAIHLFISGFLNAPWGILLILVGLASFYIREAAMFIIYSVVLAWAGISNIFSGQEAWIAFAIIQLILSFTVFRKFRRYRNAALAPGQEEGDLTSGILTAGHAEKVFPWAGCLLSSMSLGGLVLIIVGIVVYFGITGNEDLPAYLGFLEGLLVTFGVLGLGIGLASLLSGFGNKLLTIGAIAAGALVIIFEVGFVFIS